ncbi:MAG: NAD(P)-dependent oxidoreductase [Actinomycetota bacterium]|nr:NAD(P)-dependent oxidoreductase [Actinomycetota bacterium]
MRVLVTGSAGSIGSTVITGLHAAGHDVRGLDLLAHDDSSCSLGVLVGDCTDAHLATRAVDGTDAVVHLAGRPNEGPLAEELTSHVLTTATLLDAMVAAGVGRFVYASSNHAVGMTDRVELLGTDVRGRPDTFYGVAKVAAEGLLSLYADRHQVTAVSMRIGSFLDQPTSRRNLATWLSPGDCVRMVEAAISSDVVTGHTVVYGISANTDAWWDLGPGRLIGYHPVDDAQAYADQIVAGPDDEAEAARVGGPMAGPAYTRPSS